MDNFIIKGDICYSKNINKIESLKNGFLICINGKSAGVFEKIPQQYKSLPIHDYSGKLVIPGMCDLHTHAPQYSFVGLGMDYELMDWLNNKTFPEEKKYSDISYAKKAYSAFAEKLRKSVTTRACIFATVHTEATAVLMKELDKTGIFCYVGQVAMDRNAPDELCVSAEEFAEDNEQLIKQYDNTYENIKPIITPRFIPCCTDKMLDKLADLQRKYNLPVQSHLSENPDEVKLVEELCPYAEFYGDGYNFHELFGKSKENNYFNTVMAHCVYSDDDELRLMAENRVFAAHCPSSNINLASGIAPVRKMLDMGVKVGLGTDVAAGHSLSMLNAVVTAVQVSKLYFRLIDKSKKPLSFAESFYLATKGGGEFFGKVGSFEERYELDAVIVDDGYVNSDRGLSPIERLERFSYLCGEKNLVEAKYVRGKKLF